MINERGAIYSTSRTLWKSGAEHQWNMLVQSKMSRSLLLPSSTSASSDSNLPSRSLRQHSICEITPSTIIR